MLRLLLIPFSWPYDVVMRVRRFLYMKGWKRSYAAKVPVISVGNITVGGTGKTPMAAFLLRYLQESGIKAGYLSRGYGRKSHGYHLVKPNGDNALFGDESMLIKGMFPDLPVAVCEDRVEGARRLVEEQDVQLIVLDDAFQHLRIRRDLDLVMIDATRLPWYDFVFPVGRLREPRSALRHANALVLTKLPMNVDVHALMLKVSQECPDTPVCVMDFQFQGIVDASDLSSRPVSFLNSRRFVAFSGLGNNTYFQVQLKDAGAIIERFFSFSDHHPFTEEEWVKILEAARSQTEISGKFDPVAVLTTEKDYQRLKSKEWFRTNLDTEVYFVKVGLVPLIGWEGLKAQIDRLIKK